MLNVSNARESVSLTIRGSISARIHMCTPYENILSMSFQR